MSHMADRFEFDGHMALGQVEEPFAPHTALSAYTNAYNAATTKDQKRQAAAACHRCCVLIGDIHLAKAYQQLLL